MALFHFWYDTSLTRLQGAGKGCVS
jgi:hypothetical protein